VPNDLNTVDDPVIGEQDSAQYIGTSVDTLRRLRRRGEIAYVKVNSRRIGYRRSVLNQLLDARTVQVGGAQ
jgi:predicted site-specific integrase-resolvase